jgi:hypothetical protein
MPSFYNNFDPTGAAYSAYVRPSMTIFNQIIGLFESLHQHIRSSANRILSTPEPVERPYSIHAVAVTAEGNTSREPTAVYILPSMPRLFVVLGPKLP